MFKKLIIFAFLFVLFGGLIGTYLIYRSYEERKAERIARLQQQAEEVTVTVIEGWNLKQIGAYFEKQDLFTADEFKTAADAYDESSFPLTKRPANLNMEGYLFPDTYRIAKASTPEEVIEKMLTTFSARLASLGVKDPDVTYNGLTLSEIITLASIIEKESGGKGSSAGDLTLQEERDLVASVFYNRLAIGQALESDATVNFVTGKDTPGASLADLKVNSPYNTYMYPGLPPGPICSPSLGSIKAAINPAKSDFYFFLHKQPSGKVEFSKTFDEHVRKKNAP